MSRYKKYGNYDLQPYTELQGPLAGSAEVYCSWQAIWRELGKKEVLLLDCYQGVLEDELLASFQREFPEGEAISTSEFFLPAEVIREMVSPDVTDDEVFGYLSRLQLRDYIDDKKLEHLQERLVQGQDERVVLVYGAGAGLLLTALVGEHGAALRDKACLAYCNMARWEIQQRQRQGLLSNLGVENCGASAKQQYKHSYFVDWRVLDRHKQDTWSQWDWVIDCNDRQAGKQMPKMLGVELYFEGLKQVSEQPFRLVPFFDPGVWGGQWMREACGLKDYRRNSAETSSPENYAWCFDCVPEENSLQLKVDGVIMEFPSIDLIFTQARELLGEPVHARFGKEFPIRFDFLDTMGGQNLSLQVHPLTGYIQENFGMHYTQDESYYILDAEDGATVYLGLRDDVVPEAMLSDLRLAQEDAQQPFPAERHVNILPAKKHDHFLIPAGTVHCSGAGVMVLEISATPYIFTFKLWDWGRLDMDGRPRPINIEHGAKNICWERRTSWVKENLYKRIEELCVEEGFTEERTGLHEREFIETRRYWFKGARLFDTGGMERGSVHVLNLVEGEAALVRSPSDSFSPFEVHYAETFVIPAKLGNYLIEPLGAAGESKRHALICASVRLGLG